MKKLLVALSLAALASLPAFSQPGTVAPPSRYTVIVDYFARARDVSPSYADMVRAGVIDGFLKRNRQNVIDAASLGLMNIPQSNMISNPASIVNTQRDAEARRAQVIESTGARYVVSGGVTSCVFVNDSQGGKDHFMTTIVFNLVSHDLKTGASTDPEQFKVTGSGNSPADADRRAIASVSSRMEYYIDNHYKFLTEILRIEEQDKKGRFSQLYIHCGSNMGVQNGDLFLVYLEEEVAGVPSRKQIGKVRVRKVQGEDISLCSISNGGDAIAEAFFSVKRLVLVSDGKALF